MPRRAKVAAVTMILGMTAISGVLVIDNRTIGAVVVGLGLIGAAYVLFGVPTRERVLAERTTPPT